MQTHRNMKAFTLVELMVGLIVTSVILSAVATLAFAMSSASTSGGDYAFTQAQVRQATVYLSNLINKCSLICAAPGYDLAIWRADDNQNGRINVDELVYLERGADLRFLKMCQFSSATNPEVTLADLKLSTTKAQLISAHEERYASLIPDCNSVQFSMLGGSPPATDLIAITFDLVEDGVERPYEIVAATRCRAAHLLNAAGTALVTTDDD